MDEITFKELQQYHCEIKNSHCAATANRHLSLLSKMFSCAIEWDLSLERNPCKNIKKFPEQHGNERFLTTDEIRKLFKAMEQMKGKSDTAIAALKLLLLTGMRKNEVLRQRWNDVDLNGIWFLQRTKNGKSHRVLLNDEAKRLLLDLHSRRDSPFVFPSKNLAKPLVELRRCLNQLTQIAGIKPLRVHDLRHSFASVCAQNGASLLEIKALLNHSNLSTTQRYMHLTDNNLVVASQIVGNVVTNALKGN
jgi:integrase